MTKLSQLKIDPEFQNQINHPSFEETHQLEMNILKEECVLNPIITWNGHKAKRDSSITDSYSSPSKGNEFITTFKQDIQGHKKGLSKEEKQNLKDAVKSIYSPRRLADGEAMMCEIQGAQEDFVRRWEMCFRECPDILTEPKNNEKLLIFIDRASRYLQTVKDRLNNDGNQNSQTV